MRHAREILAKNEYDPEAKAVDDVVELVDQHHKRRINDRVNFHRKSVEEANLRALLQEQKNQLEESIETVKFDARKNPRALVHIRKLQKKPAHLLVDGQHYLKETLLDDEITAKDLNQGLQKPKESPPRVQDSFDAGAYGVSTEGMKER